MDDGLQEYSANVGVSEYDVYEGEFSANMEVSEYDINEGEFTANKEVLEYSVYEGEFSVNMEVSEYNVNKEEFSANRGVPGHGENGGERPSAESTYIFLRTTRAMFDDIDSMRLKERCDVVGAPVLTDGEYTITSIDHLEEIEKTLMGLPMIQGIKIRDPCNRDIESVLEILMKHCRDIRQLDIGYGLNVKGDRLLELTEKFPNLDSLCVPLWFETEDVVKKLGKLLHLKHLEIYRVTRSVTPKLDLKPIAGGCPNLVHLDIRCCEYTAVDFVYLLEQKKQLQTLRFTSIYFEEGTFVPLSKCTFLEEVSCDYFSSENLPLADFVDEIVALPHLRTVSLGVCADIGEKDLERLSRISFASHVTTLDIKYTHLGEDFPRIIASCFPNLHELCIENCSECEYRILQNLLHFNDLQRLELVRWPFSHEWLTVIPRCKQLKDLTLRKCYSLDDENSKRLVELLNLRSLTITESFNLTNGFLESFPGSEVLEKLHVQLEEVSEECVDRLQSRLHLTAVKVEML